MNILTKQDIKELVERENGVCASIYLPTFRAGQDVDQNKITFKNLLREVEKNFKEYGLRRDKIDSLLEEPNQLLADSSFWRDQLDGLAAFISGNGFSYHRLPLKFEPLAFTGNRFHLKPVMPMLSNDGRFYLLALNLSGLKLFHGTHYSISRLRLRNVPETLEESMKYDDPERQIQYHSGVSSPGSRVKYKPTFHGQGVAGDEDKKYIIQFFQKVDKGVKSLLGSDNSPLILAGVDYLIPLYRKVNSYPFLLENGIPGNTDDKSTEQLHREGWELVKPAFRQKQEKAAEEYLALAGREEGKSSSDLEEVVPAASYGRVQSLFVPVDKHVWGKFSSDSGEVSIGDNQDVTSDDLLDLAAVQTLFHGGEVFAVEGDHMPGGAEYAAAVFRF